MRSELYVVPDLTRVDESDESSPRLRLVGARDTVEAFGDRMTLDAWARLTGISVRTLRRRLTFLPAEAALLLPDWTHVDPLARPGSANAWSWELLDYEDDPWAQTFVAKHRAGATLEQVGNALGVVKERVRLIEESALAKLARCGDRTLLLRLFRERFADNENDSEAHHE
jgi:hypothetical protein